VPLTDEEIVQRVQQGENGLFELVFDRYYDRVERYLRRCGVPERDLSDIASDVFVRAYQRVDQFRVGAGTSYAVYLFRIARNAAIDALRQRSRQPEEEWDEALGDRVSTSTDNPEASALQADELSRIRRALKRLSDTDREIISLAYDRELSSKEIMQVMDKPSVTAVTTHLYKAIRRLRAHVESEAAPALRRRER
jgi:RNA polymerase sigma-70 factor, ECF subfamily